MAPDFCPPYSDPNPFYTSTVFEDVIIVPVIKYIIGNCKGNNIHCSKKITLTLSTLRLCRDCNIPSLQADDVDLKCVMAKMPDFKDKTKQELNEKSHYQIKNVHHDLPYGGDPYNMHSRSPLELLHNLQMGNCNKSGRDLLFKEAASDYISTSFTGIYLFLKHQSECDLPQLRVFCDEISSIKCLKAIEHFSRVFAVFLSLINPFLVKTLEKL